MSLLGLVAPSSAWHFLRGAFVLSVVPQVWAVSVTSVLLVSGVVFMLLSLVTAGIALVRGRRRAAARRSLRVDA
jgi:uncharacterized membrane protein